MFSFFKKNKAEKQEVNNMATLDEKDIQKAKEDISEKGKDTQTERDRIDESVAAQLKDQGKEDTQSAKDRIDESEGMEKEEAARHKKIDGQFANLEMKIDKALELIEKMASIEKKEEVDDEKAFEKAKEKYGANPQVFDSDEATPKAITPAEAMAIVKSLKI